MLFNSKLFGLFNSKLLGLFNSKLLGVDMIRVTFSKIEGMAL